MPHLPSAGEFVVFNRSWYNRAGVERVMGFCTGTDVETFFDTVIDFEALLIRSGLELRKYYLDISRGEQKKRLAERKTDPLKTWKNSPVDAKAQKKWDDYTEARDEMFRRTNHTLGPWRIVRANQQEARPAGADLRSARQLRLQGQGRRSGQTRPRYRFPLVAGSGQEGLSGALKEVLYASLYSRTHWRRPDRGLRLFC